MTNKDYGNELRFYIVNDVVCPLFRTQMAVMGLTLKAEATPHFFPTLSSNVQK